MLLELPFLLTIIFLLVILTFGLVVSRCIENRLIYLFPLSICLGVSTYVILLHLFSLVIGIKKSTYASLFMILFLTLLTKLIYKKRAGLEIGLPKHQFFTMLFFSFTLSALSLSYLLYFDSFDSLHQLVGPMASQNHYPPLHPYNPDMHLVYHYGGALLASSLKIFSGIDTWLSFYPIQTIFIFVTPLSIFCLLHSISKNFVQSLLGTLIGCFCANLTSLELLTLFSTDNFSRFKTNLHENIVWMCENGFADSTHKALISPNMSIALPLSVTFFYLCTSKHIKSNLSILLISLTSAFLFFTYEAFWLPIVCSIFLLYIYKTLNKTLVDISTKRVTLLLILLITSPLIAGGIIGDNNKTVSSSFYFDPKLYLFSWSGLIGKVYTNEWFQNNLVVSNGDGCSFFKINIFSRYFFLEFGLPLVFLLFTILWLIFIKKNTISIILLISTLIAFSIPLLFTYIPRETDPNRFFIYARFIFSILFGEFIGYLLSLKLNKILRLFVIVLIFVTVFPCIVWLIPKKFSEHDYRYCKISEIDKRTLKWLSNKVKSGDRGLGPRDIPYKQVELLNIAGVYGTSADPNVSFQEETRKTAFNTLNPCLLKELKVRWIYLDNEMLSKIPQEKIRSLVKEKVFVLHHRIKNKKEIREIYEFLPNNISAYCKNKDYKWAIGKMEKGSFVVSINAKTKQPISFLSRKKALKKLEYIKKSIKNKKENYWYRVEAIKA